MSVELIGALVALVFVLILSYGVSLLLARRLNKAQQARFQAQRARALTVIEFELEKLESQSTARSLADDRVYAQLIRRRNALANIG